jgi:hypothetical protein
MTAADGRAVEGREVGGQRADSEPVDLVVERCGQFRRYRYFDGATPLCL